MAGLGLLSCTEDAAPVHCRAVDLHLLPSPTAASLVVEVHAPPFEPRTLALADAGGLALALRAVTVTQQCDPESSLFETPVAIHAAAAMPFSAVHTVLDAVRSHRFHRVAIEVPGQPGRDVSMPTWTCSPRAERLIPAVIAVEIGPMLPSGEREFFVDDDAGWIPVRHLMPGLSLAAFEDPEDASSDPGLAMEPPPQPRFRIEGNAALRRVLGGWLADPQRGLEPECLLSGGDLSVQEVLDVVDLVRATGFVQITFPGQWGRAFDGVVRPLPK